VVWFRYVGTARRGKRPLPPVVRYGAFGFFSFIGMYAGFLSAGPLCAQRVLSVPNSRVADDLRVVIGDWQARVPVGPDAPLPDSESGAPPAPSASAPARKKALTPSLPKS
jgi:hypothetical protein